MTLSDSMLLRQVRELRIERDMYRGLYLSGVMDKTAHLVSEENRLMSEKLGDPMDAEAVGALT